MHAFRLAYKNAADVATPFSACMRTPCFCVQVLTLFGYSLLDLNIFRLAHRITRPGLIVIVIMPVVSYIAVATNSQDDHSKLGRVGACPLSPSHSPSFSFSLACSRYPSRAPYLVSLYTRQPAATGWGTSLLLSVNSFC